LHAQTLEQQLRQMETDHEQHVATLQCQVNEATRINTLQRSIVADDDADCCRLQHALQVAERASGAFAIIEHEKMRVQEEFLEAQKELHDLKHGMIVLRAEQHGVDARDEAYWRRRIADGGGGGSVIEMLAQERKLIAEVETLRRESYHTGVLSSELEMERQRFAQRLKNAKAKCMRDVTIAHRDAETLRGQAKDEIAAAVAECNAVAAEQLQAEIQGAREHRLEMQATCVKHAQRGDELQSELAEVLRCVADNKLPRLGPKAWDEAEVFDNVGMGAVGTRAVEEWVLPEQPPEHHVQQKADTEERPWSQAEYTLPPPWVEDVQPPTRTQPRAKNVQTQPLAENGRPPPQAEYVRPLPQPEQVRAPPLHTFSSSLQTNTFHQKQAATIQLSTVTSQTPNAEENELDAMRSQADAQLKGMVAKLTGRQNIMR